MKLKDLYNNDKFINILKEKLKTIDTNKIEYEYARAIIGFEGMDGIGFYDSWESDTLYCLANIWVADELNDLKSKIDEKLIEKRYIYNDVVGGKYGRLIDLEDEIKIFIELKFETRRATNLDELKEVDFNISKEE